jgi:predicted RNA-binding protein YlqC (UPF0109 family)
MAPEVCSAKGKQGHTLRALRTILSDVATMENRRIVLEILE